MKVFAPDYLGNFINEIDYDIGITAEQLIHQTKDELDLIFYYQFVPHDIFAAEVMQHSEPAKYLKAFAKLMNKPWHETGRILLMDTDAIIGTVRPQYLKRSQFITFT